MAIGVFTLGGAAVGKTATIQQRFIGTAHLTPEQRGDAPNKPPQFGFHPRRHYDPDQYKPEIGPMYSDQADADGLHGPSGPVDLDGFNRYPPAEKAAARGLVLNLGFSSLQDLGEMARLQEKQ